MRSAGPEDRTGMGSKDRHEVHGRLDTMPAAALPSPRLFGHVGGAWWARAQDDRREVFEAQSRHVGIGLSYLPEWAFVDPEIDVRRVREAS